MAIKNKKIEFNSNNNFRTKLRGLKIQRENIDNFQKDISKKVNSEESYKDLVDRHKKQKKQHEMDWESIKSKIKSWVMFGAVILFGICVLIVYGISIAQILGYMSTDYSDFRGLIFGTVLMGIGGFIGWILNEFLGKK